MEVMVTSYLTIPYDLVQMWKLRLPWTLGSDGSNLPHSIYGGQSVRFNSYLLVLGLFL